MSLGYLSAAYRYTTLEELAQEQVYEFAFFGAPLRLRGSTGSPMRTFAMPFAK